MYITICFIVIFNRKINPFKYNMYEALLLVNQLAFARKFLHIGVYHQSEM